MMLSISSWGFRGGVRFYSTSSAPKIIFKTVKEEIRDPIATNIKGTVPAWLNGSLYYNGPALFEIGEDKFDHLFDGLAMVQHFSFSDGAATYRNKFLDTKCYQLTTKHSQIICNEFGTLSNYQKREGFFGKWMSSIKNILLMSDNANANILSIGDKLYACTYQNIACQIDKETLAVIGREEIADYSHIIAPRFHSHPEKGALYGLSVSFRGTARSMHVPTYHFEKISHHQHTKGGKKGYTDDTLAERIFTWEPRGSHFGRHFVFSDKKFMYTNYLPSYLHSFGMTESFFVLIEQPLYVDLKELRRCQQPLWKCLKFYPEKDTVIHLIDRMHEYYGHSFLNLDKLKRLKDRTFVTDPLCFLHHVNAYEDSGHVVVDLCGYDSADVLDGHSMARAATGGLPNNGRLTRFALPIFSREEWHPKDKNMVKLDYTTAAVYSSLESGVCRAKPEILFDTDIDYPCINYEMCNGKKYRYIYGLGKNSQKLLKMDITKQKTSVWNEDGCFPSEPIFVASPGSKLEDEGIILSLVINTNSGGKPFLLILSADSFTELGRVIIPSEEVPYPGSGLFLSETK